MSYNTNGPNPFVKRLSPAHPLSRDLVAIAPIVEGYGVEQIKGIQPSIQTGGGANIGTTDPSIQRGYWGKGVAFDTNAMKELSYPSGNPHGTRITLFLLTTPGALISFSAPIATGGNNANPDARIRITSASLFTVGLLGALVNSNITIPSNTPVALAAAIKSGVGVDFYMYDYKARTLSVNTVSNATALTTNDTSLTFNNRINTVTYYTGNIFLGGIANHAWTLNEFQNFYSNPFGMFQDVGVLKPVRSFLLRGNVYEGISRLNFVKPLLKATGVSVVPVYTGGSILSKSKNLVAVGIRTVPTFRGSGNLSHTCALISGGSSTIPVYSGTSRLNSGHARLIVETSFDVPVYSSDTELTKKCILISFGIRIVPVYHGNSNLSKDIELSSLALHIPPTYIADANLTTGSAILLGSGYTNVPVYSGEAYLSKTVDIYNVAFSYVPRFTGKAHLSASHPDIISLVKFAVPSYIGKTDLSKRVLLDAIGSYISHSMGSANLTVSHVELVANGVNITKGLIYNGVLYINNDFLGTAYIKTEFAEDKYIKISPVTLIG